MIGTPDTRETLMGSPIESCVRSLTIAPSNFAAVASPARVKKSIIVAIGNVAISQGITFFLCVRSAIFRYATALKIGSYTPVSHCGKTTTRQLLSAV
jgi:hypothetical protein